MDQTAAVQEGVTTNTATGVVQTQTTGGEPVSAQGTQAGPLPSSSPPQPSPGPSPLNSSPGSAAGPTPPASQPAPATPGVSKPVAQITQPEHASSALKSKISELHNLVHNAAGYATMPIHAIEAVVADVSYLLGIIRTKL